MSTTTVTTRFRRRWAAGLLAAGLGLTGAGRVAADDERRAPAASPPADARLREAIKELEDAIDKLKDQPEAQARLQRTLDQMRRATAAAGDLPAVPRDGGRRADPFFGGLFDPRPTGVRLGVAIAPVPEPLADQLDLPAGSGLLVRDVLPGSAAEKAGLKRNDVLVKFDGKDVSTEEARFHSQIADAKAGEKTDVVVIRKGKKETVAVELPSLPRPAAARPVVRAPAAPRVTFEVMAVTVANGTFEIKAEAGKSKYAVAGKLERGQPVPSKITVTDGKELRYESLDAVPDGHKAAVRQLLAGVGGR